MNPHNYCRGPNIPVKVHQSLQGSQFTAVWGRGQQSTWARFIFNLEPQKPKILFHVLLKWSWTVIIRDHCTILTLSTRQLPVLSPMTLKCGLLNVWSLSNNCNDFIATNCLDLFIATETWITPNDTVPLIEAAPVNYSLFHLPQHSGLVGGTAVIYRSILSALFSLLVS